jgi:CRISPR system Cascade subunit CasB
MESDRAMGARLRRADNPNMEYQSWEYFARFGVNLENRRERKAFATVVAALARAKPKSDGRLGIGRAIALSYSDGKDNDQAKARLRRLLACITSEDACDVLRPLLRLVASRGQSVRFENLLRDLLYFDNFPEKTKERWAQEFFSSAQTENAEEE